MTPHRDIGTSMLRHLSICSVSLWSVEEEQEKGKEEDKEKDMDKGGRLFEMAPPELVAPNIFDWSFKVWWYFRMVCDCISLGKLIQALYVGERVRENKKRKNSGLLPKIWEDQE